MKIAFFSNSFHTISGCDVISANLARQWLKKDHSVKIFTNEKGAQFYRSNSIPKSNIQVWKSSYFDRFGTVISDIIKSNISICRSFGIRLKDFEIVISSTDLWPDLLGGFIQKLRNKELLWVVCFYLVTPLPKYNHELKNFIKQWLFWLSQKISIYIVRKYANVVWTASFLDREFFLYGKNLDKTSIISIRGGITLGDMPVMPKTFQFDAIYTGRFHPQKCIHTLLDIWKQVCFIHPDLKLALIGGGPETIQVLDQVRRLGLVKNVSFLGILYGRQKDILVKSSKVFISASLYDSGNVALDEALALGVPGIIFDLPRLNYPVGVQKIKAGDSKSFAEGIIELISNDQKRYRMGIAGYKFIKQFNWDDQAAKLASFLEIQHNQPKTDIDSRVLDI